MTQTLKVRSIVAAVLAPLVLAIGALVLVADDDGAALQKLSVGAPQAGGERSAGDATSESSTASALASPMFAPSNYVLKGELPDLGDRAPAYRYLPEDGTAAVARVARALGMSGPVESGDGGWAVRDGDLTLAVNDAPGLPWFVSQCAYPNEPLQRDGGDPDGVSVGCAVEAKAFPAAEPRPEVTDLPLKGEPTIEPGTEPGTEPGSYHPTCPLKIAPDGSVAECGPGPYTGLPPDDQPLPIPEPVRPEGLPDRQSAEKIARAALDRLGSQTADLQIEDGFTQWYAWAPVRVGELETQASASISVGVNGRIVGGNGLAAEVERLGDYPLVSTSVGFERLQRGLYLYPGHHRDIRSDIALPVPATSAPTPGPPPELTAEPEPPIPCVDPECVSPMPVPEPGTIPTYPPYEPPTIEITGAHLVLVQVDDTLVPAYVFETSSEFGGDTPPVPAVIDDLLLDGS